MNILLKRVLDRLVRTGNLKVTGPKGSTVVFGDGSGEPVHMHIKTRHAERAISFDPMLAVPEAYMDGELDILEGGVLGVIDHGAGQSHLSVFTYNRFGELALSGVITVGVPDANGVAILSPRADDRN